MQLATEKQLLEFYGSKVELRMEKWVEIVFEGVFSDVRSNWFHGWFSVGRVDYNGA